MSTVIRRCTSCGHHDLRRHWKSVADAVADDALAAPFGCPKCGWPEAELVDIDGRADPEGGTE